jgi:phospholipase C
LQFLEKFLTHKLGREVRETNISQWRRTVCGDLTSAFRPATELVDDRLKTPPRNEFIAEIHKARLQPLPTGYHALTDEEVRQIQTDLRKFRTFARQEPGTKPSCSLPYELAVEGSLSDDRKTFAIRLEARKNRFGDRSVGAPFTAYARGIGGELEVRNYAVSAGDQLEDSWSVAEFKDGRYDVAIYGPNGFYRHFHGTAADPSLAIQLVPTADTSTERTEAAPDLQFEIKNSDTRVHRVRIEDRAYGADGELISLESGEARIVSVPTDRGHRWYDLSVRIDGVDNFSKAYAGRVETGARATTDPAMA